MNRLARALVPIAHRALCLPVARPVEDEPCLASALDAIDGFVAQPTASRYLAASRTLCDLARLRRRPLEVERLARRAMDAELGRLVELSLLPSTLEVERPHADADEVQLDPIEILRALPPDPRAARRMHALVALLDAHRALAARVRLPDHHRARMTLPEAAARRPDRKDRKLSRPIDGRIDRQSDRRGRRR